MSKYKLDKLNSYRNTVIEHGDPVHGSCYLHGQEIAEWTPEYVRLNFRGWATPTTRRRMNEVLKALDVDARVHQVKGVQYLDNAELSIYGWNTVER